MKNKEQQKKKIIKKKAPTIYVKAITVWNRSKMSLMFSILKGVKIEELKKGKTKKNDTFLNPFLDMVKVYFEIFIF